jgi:nucleoside-diphosphate-sugar epimerase
VKAYFLQMMRWISCGVPLTLPLGGIENQRSPVGLGNLVDLIFTPVSHPGGANQTFLVSGGEDLSTANLVRRVAMGNSARLIPVPANVLRAVGRGLGRGDIVRRLCGTLQVDITKTRELLGWTPPVGVAEGLRATIKAFWGGRAN